MPYLSHVNISNSDGTYNTTADIKDVEARDAISNIPLSDLEATGTLEYWGAIALTAGQKAQGLTTDGTYLYMAAVDESDGISNPRIYRLNISTQGSPDANSAPKKGHYNCMNYHDGYIYATGFNASDIQDRYDQIYKYSYASNTGTAITTKEKYWNFDIGTTPYGTRYYIGTLAGIPGFNVWQEQTSGTGEFYPFTTSPLEHGNGINQGCAIYGNKWICSIISDPGNNNVYPMSNDELRIVNLAGSLRKRITLKHDVPLMLQDICFAGNKAYINATDGKIYTLSNIDRYFRGYYEDTYPTLYMKPCFLYGNENGTETYITGTYGANTGKLLKSFQISRLAMANHFSDAAGFFVMRSDGRFPFRINPVDASIVVDVAYADGLYSYDLTMRYNRASDPNYYTYSLASIKGLYRNADGDATQINATSDEDIQTVCNNVFYKDNSYIHTIVGNPTCLYTFDPLSI